ncbi:Lysosomal Pro-X carboxypeptidase [Frankliniella fusca]|uniref:Lysosomal Pro-X carboxypeptidase n=1 Tax=Frankliniella fusca TaxID=407009 RepID=A0AAE1HCW1_9NEOP|nr:Lysosomal Pro-X carboxypeptidase [Frankliniella fusca]
MSEIISYCHSRRAGGGMRVGGRGGVGGGGRVEEEEVEEEEKEEEEEEEEEEAAHCFRKGRHHQPSSCNALFQHMMWPEWGAKAKPDTARLSPGGAPAEPPPRRPRGARQCPADPHSPQMGFDSCVTRHLAAAAPVVLLSLLLLLPHPLRAEVQGEVEVEDPTTPTYGYVTKYITVPVDQFSFSRNDSFQLRYLVNDTWWDKHKPGPIFFYTGNEGDITLFAQNTGFMWDIAAEFRALVVFAEHRYYGKSMPFGTKSFADPQHLGYLTAQQALADFVAVIDELRRGQSFPRQSPVIAFGGSYGGMLSAWIRMKYPHVVAGAISASAPVLMSAGLTPCDAFSRIVTSVYHAAAPKCAENIRRSWKALRNISNTGESMVSMAQIASFAADDGKAWLSKTFSLKKSIHGKADVDVLLGWLNEAYTDVAMANYPYPANFLGDMPANPVNEVCKPLRKRVEGERELAKAIFQGVSVYFNYTGRAKALDVNNSDSLLDVSGWDYQACTEMAMPMCSDGRKDMFERAPWSWTEYSDACFRTWKVRPRFNMTRWEFGGRDLKGASNIVFSNGLLDPWSAGGVVRNMSDSVVAVLIPEGAHHLDLRGQDPRDPPSVRGARRLHRQHIRKWIKEHWRLDMHAHAAAEHGARENRLLPEEPIFSSGEEEGGAQL